MDKTDKSHSWFSLEIDEVYKLLDVPPQTGLSEDEVIKRRVEDGPNELPEGVKITLLQRVLAQLNDFLVLILVGASIISIALGETVDGLVILAIIIANAIMGIIQESKADKALESLREMSAPHTTVIRGGDIHEIPARDLVKGDIVFIEAGNLIPADLRLIESINLKMDESSLTGESVPVGKNAQRTLDPDTPLGDRENSAFMGTIATYGRGKGIVVGTGMDTQIGLIAGMIRSYGEEKTHLQKKLDHMGRWLGLGILGICALVFLTGILRGEPAFETFMVAISLAVAAIPEGLPAVVTLVLALGMQRMVKRNAIMRRLLAVETLGTTTVICSDKTGTLTQNEMTVVQIFTNGKLIKVTGTGYEPKGKFLVDDTSSIDPVSEEQLKKTLKGGALCNDARLHEISDSESADGKTWGILGDPTEGALVVAAAKAGLDKDTLEKTLPRVEEIPFDSDRKRMTTIHKEADGYTAYIKGAPDITLALCTRILKDGKVVPFSKADMEKVLEINGAMAEDALRVLAIAAKPLKDLPEDLNLQDTEEGLVFLGLIGMIDPPRPEAIEAIAKCRQAGIIPKMITGDYKTTAMAIAKSLGIAGEGDKVLTGEKLEQMDEEELASMVQKVNVYARVSPAHKVNIVEALKKHGHIVAMTGDGVNDALALKRADIGIAMGITGTDVAKGTADMILTDDNFASIVSAVEEGRVIYSNIRKFVYFLLSCNIGEILVIFISMLAGWPVPLIPLQILWVNLITDAFPALALGMEEGEPHIMSVPPRDPEEPIINKDMLIGIIVQGIFITFATLFAFYYGNTYGTLRAGRSMAFATLISAELLRAYSSRSERYSLFSIGVFKNRFMVGATLLSFTSLLAVMYIPSLEFIFELVPLTLGNWVIVISLSALPLIASEVMKGIIRRIRPVKISSSRH